MYRRIPALALLALSAAAQGIEEDFSRGMTNWWVEGGERVWVESGRLRKPIRPPVLRGMSRQCGVAASSLAISSSNWMRNVSSTPNANNINLFFNYTDPSGVPLEKTAESRKSAGYGLYHQINGYIITFLNDTDQNSGKARVRIRRNPGFKLLAETFAYHCRAGATYHLKVVKEGGDIRFSVDGNELLRAHDPEPLGPG
jgi:hypothetical protein